MLKRFTIARLAEKTEIMVRDIAGVASSILATPTIENPVKSTVCLGFCLPDGGGRPRLAQNISRQILGMKMPGEPSEIPIRYGLADMVARSLMMPRRRTADGFSPKLRVSRILRQQTVRCHGRAGNLVSRQKTTRRLRPP